MTDKTDNELRAEARAAFVRYVESNGGKAAGKMSTVLDEMAEACVEAARISRESRELWLPLEPEPEPTTSPSLVSSARKIAEWAVKAAEPLPPGYPTPYWPGKPK